MAGVPPPHWGVIGGGPCGVAAVAKLIDNGLRVTWVDAGGFRCGRMGRLYRNVPANTTNGKFTAAFRSSAAFEFDKSQCRRRRAAGGKPVLSDLPPDACSTLSPFVDALEDTVKVLLRKSNALSGTVTAINGHKTAGRLSWQLTVSQTSIRKTKSLGVDAVILSPGASPFTVDMPFVIESGLVQHHMDKMVDPGLVRTMVSAQPTLRHSTWAVVGNSHTGMLVLKNLVESGVKNVVSIYKSDIRYHKINCDGKERYILCNIFVVLKSYRSCLKISRFWPEGPSCSVVQG